MAPYYQTRAFSTSLGGHTIHFISKPGMANWDRVSPAGHLLADVVRPEPADRALLLGCGHGALGAALARRAGEVVMVDTSAVALAMAEQTIRANGLANAFVRAPAGAAPVQKAAFDIVVIEATGERNLTRRWLAETHQSLKLGGRLYLAGANDHGVRSAIADADALFSGATVLAYRQGSRAAQARKTTEIAGAAWAAEDGIAPGTWFEFEAAARGHAFRLRSLPGVFAYDRVDEGTRLLLDAIAIPAGSRVLDVGCGSGVIGLLAARLSAQYVDMVDVNLLAVAAAAENIALNGVANARAFAGDGVPEGERYDVVATNPPFHLGKATDYAIAPAFVDGARRALKPGGQLWLVANRFLKYDQPLRAAFADVVCAAETRSYRVWKAT
jgi:16S rRNA (guanine1207-N2)-methyltransferase